MWQAIRTSAPELSQEAQNGVFGDTTVQKSDLNLCQLFGASPDHDQAGHWPIGVVDPAWTLHDHSIDSTLKKQSLRV